jgi:DNA polymerase-1
MLTIESGCKVVQSDYGLAELETRLRQARLIGYDAETEGLDPYVHNIVGHVLSFGPTPSSTYYVPVRHAGGGNIRNVDLFEHLLAEIASAPDVHWFGHNVQFDLRFLNRHAIRVRGTLEDTQVNAAIINELAPSFSLEASCWSMRTIAKKGDALYQHLAAKFGGPADRSAMQYFWRLSGCDPIATDYATGDGVATWDLRTKQIERMREEQLDYIYRLEQRITRVVYRMHLRGIRVDVDELERVQAFADQKVREARQQFPEGFSALSSKDVRAWLEAQGYRDAPYTPKGAKLASEGHLEEADKYRSYNEAYLKTIPPGQALLDIRKFSNLGASFINPLRTKHLRSDGRVHCTYYQMASDSFGTVTGRFSCAEPNLQQVPKRNRELGLPFRRVFVPDPGCEWLTADLNQCEPRILAHYSGAKSLLDGYSTNPPVDAHAAVTIAAGLEKLLGIPFKEAREYGKRLNQTLLTGGGKKKIISMMGERGAEVYDAYFEASPEIRRLLKSAELRMKTRGYVVSYLGRRARLDGPERAYVAGNRLFQCGNADIIKQALADIDDFYETETNDQVHLMNTVHDSVDVNVPEGMRDVALEGLKFMAQFGPGRRFYLRVPMAYEYGFGPSWGDATYLAQHVLAGHEVDDASLLDPNPVKPNPNAREAA